MAKKNGSMNSWSILFSDAHRPFFLGGAVFAVLSIAMWLLHLLNIMPYTLPFAQARMHMAQMVYFFFSFFFFGFLLTVFPRLLSVSALTPRRYMPMFFCLFAAAVLFSFGLHAGKAWAQAGAGLAVFSNVWFTLELLRMLRQSRYLHKQMPVFMWIGVAFACPGSLALMAYARGGDEFWGMAAEAIGIYGFLFPTIYAVAYRMVPIFTATSGRDVVRDRFGLHFMLVFSLARMLLTIMDLHAWYWLADFGLFFVIGHQCWQWRIWRRKPYAIQSVLHWALFWFPLAFLLSAGINLAEWLSGDIWLRMEQAALHALVIGGFGTLILGMATRVTLGHAGRPVLADIWTIRLFLAFQIAPLLRVVCGMLSEAWPAFEIGIYVAGAAWVLIFFIWALRYMPFYFSENVSNRILESEGRSFFFSTCERAFFTRSSSTYSGCIIMRVHFHTSLFS
ncbi:MAG: NnrS family protein, partial [Mariprofundaceae bacterium]|nr:NnrS family protein [Mariprofundaceae bacterium]